VVGDAAGSGYGEARKRLEMTDIDRSNSLTDLAHRIKAEHKAVAAALQSAVLHAMAAGDLLIEAKKQVPHGKWLPWIDEHCKLSRRTVQLYMKLAEHREIIEKEQAKSAMGVAHLTINEAAALCVLAGRIEKIMDFARRAQNGEELVDLCIENGFGYIKDETYNPFHGRSPAEIREWVLFGWFIGDRDFQHIEWLLQGGSDEEHQARDHPEGTVILPSAFQNVDRWMGAEGERWRAGHSWGWKAKQSAKCHKAWAKFKAEYADKTLQQIADEMVKLHAEYKQYGLPAVVHWALGQDEIRERNAKDDPTRGVKVVMPKSWPAFVKEGGKWTSTQPADE
jgi:hypothetical protein